MQLMAERAAAFRSASGSASNYGTSTMSSSPHASPPVQTGATPPVPIVPSPPPPPHDQPGVPEEAVPGPIHLELDVPAHVPYATLRVEDNLAQPGHDSLRRLYPHKTRKHLLQKWHWDISINETVKVEFNKRTMFRLTKIVSDWKDKLRGLGDAAKSILLSTVVWEGLKAYWTNGQNADVATNCSTSRNTKLPDGTTTLMTHTSG
ncbi:unnamed protein product [Cochlearia groenlandica]